MSNKILVVCTGNICHSPTMKRLLRQFHPALTVSSAGLGALVGKGADPCVISVAQTHNLSLGNHRARQITGRMYREYDLILTMEKRHISALCEMMPRICGRVVLFGHWDSGREIPDPYRKNRDSFDAVYALLERSTRQWAQALSAEQGKRRRKKQDSLLCR